MQSDKKWWQSRERFNYRPSPSLRQMPGRQPRDRNCSLTISKDPAIGGEGGLGARLAFIPNGQDSTSTLTFLPRATREGLLKKKRWGLAPHRPFHPLPRSPDTMRTSTVWAAKGERHRVCVNLYLGLLRSSFLGLPVTDGGGCLMSHTPGRSLSSS